MSALIADAADENELACRVLRLIGSRKTVGQGITAVAELEP